MTGLNHARRDGILSYVARDMGFSSPNALLQHAMMADQCAGICIECHTIIDDIEPDQDSGWCSCCHGQHVKSVLVVGEVL